MRRRVARFTIAAVMIFGGIARNAAAQGALDSKADDRARLTPSVVTVDGSGHITVRAVRVGQPLRVDGSLDEAVYTTTPPISDFIQQEPDEGRPATERTEAWVLFDRDNIYVSARCWDSHPERM